MLAMVRKRKKKNKSIVLFIFIVLIIIGIYFITNNPKETGDNVKQANVTEDTKDNTKDEITLEEKLAQEKYFIKNNLKRYVDYYNKNNSLSLNKVITDVNANLDKEKYKDVFETDLSKGNLMLVNKYYYLKDNYIPNDLVVLTDEYNIGKNNTMRKVAADAFMEMSNAALLENISIKNASAFRSYDYQVTLYNNYVSKDGKEAADTYSARPGFSEHQTGLATDINQINSGFENTDAFKWLDKNAHKYGFILRFPKNKEDVTGYTYESWHYRYVGKEVAKIIKDENLTLEEYYAYYVEGQ